MTKKLSAKAARALAVKETEKYKDTIYEKAEITKRIAAIALLERSPELIRLIANTVLADIQEDIPYYKGGQYSTNGYFKDCRLEGTFNIKKGSLGEYLKVREKKPRIYWLKSRKYSKIARDWANDVYADEIAATIPKECDRTVAKLIAHGYVGSYNLHFEDLDTYNKIDSVLELFGIEKTIPLEVFAKKYAEQKELPACLKLTLDNKREALAKYLADRERTLSSVPNNYADMFPLARTIKRHFVLHIGPTNSGKTYKAVEVLEKAGEGVYLAPLRLLAVEQYERINSDGLACNLLTGEEEQYTEDARILSATVEMADLNTHIPCAVIDECQLVSDEDRGGAWTSAILGLPAEEIHLCASSNAETILLEMIEMCGDTYEIIRTDGKTPLVIEEVAFNSLKDVQPGDALIVFSRKNVHAVGADLQKKGHKVSIVYGALPPDVRNNQAEKFRTGKTDVVVATDAIGMGMNLPIRRIVFLEQHKFDGHVKRILKPQEVKQIAGRAGRYGIYDTGYVNSFGAKAAISKRLSEQDEDVITAMIDFPKALIGNSVRDAVKLWREVPIRKGFARSSTGRILHCAEYLEKKTSDTELVYELSTIPFDWDDNTTRDVWLEYAQTVVEERPLKFDCSHMEKQHANMKFLEGMYKQADVMYAFADRYGTDEDKEYIVGIKAELSKAMIRILQAAKLEPRKCSCCGKHLEWNYAYGMCDKCHRRNQSYY